uniref:DNA topoisomerase n=2 Tax=Davidia involucrata TaxID=16924 RepID=A0A5B6Z8L9_DAVIN
MAIVQQVHRSLFGTTTTTSSTSCRFFFGNFSTSSSRLQSIMLKLQNRVLQNYPAMHLQCSPFGNGGGYEKCSQFKFRKVKVSCIVKANQPKGLRLKSERDIHICRSLADGSRCAITIQAQLEVGFHNTSRPVTIFSCGLLGDGIKLSSPYYEAFAKRSFSQIPRAVMNKIDNVGVRDGRAGGNTPAFKVFNKHWKRSKTLAAHRRNVEGEVQAAAFNQELGKNASNTKVSAFKDVDMVNSREQPVGDNKKDVNFGSSVSSSPVSNNNQVSKAAGKLKQQSRSKKNSQKSSGTNAASDATAQPKVCKMVSQAKRPSTTKNNQSPPASVGNSTGNTAMEVLDKSVSKKQQPKRTTGNSRRKGKSIKEANALIKSDAALPVSSGYESPQKQKPHMSGKSKPQGQRTVQQLYPPTGKSVLVVESVTKAKVIQGYLGNMFEVLPSYGHVRDLAARSGSVRPDDDFGMVWEVPSAAWTHLKSIKVALSGVENLILASDPDREGEAIAWHIIEMLQQQDALREDITVARVVFNEITESSIKSALQSPRDIDVNLVHAYLARRALDYLIGFNISPLLWRKLPGCQSAGRVQSAALSLICDREMEIDEFKPQEYWTVEVDFNKKELGSLVNNFPFSSHLTHLDSKKLNQLSISSHAEAKDIEQKINSSNFKVLGCKRNKMRKNPPTPYITSTIQQDAANKLHFTATYTMKLAQKLYEGVQLSNEKAAGLITYIRTDGLHISNEGAKDIRSLVIERYGQDFASESARKYFKKVKNAQEAHEAIRPTDIRRLPSTLVGILDEDSLKLYALIWARTMACQMEPATIDQIQLDIGNSEQSIVFRSACSRVEFLGYQAVYKDLEAKAIRYNENEGNDRDETFKVLSNLKVADALCLGKVELKQHHTQPPPRYSEGSLVKKLEELGIGRPSTYATIIKVLQDRNYMTIKSRILYPEFRGRMVSAFLSHHFSEVTDYSFTADMETELDNVSAGLTEWKGLLRDYWTRFSKYCDHASNVHIHQVEKMLEKTFGDFLFASLPDKSRTCPSCLEGTLIFKVSRFGAGYFIGCDQHPKCKYIAKTLYGNDEEEDTPQNNNTVEEPKLLGLHPSSNEKILLKNGPYGYYVQLGEDRKGYLPKRASVSHIKEVNSITLEDALELLRYPVTLGNHPEDGQPVILKLAKLGFSIRHRRTIAPVPKSMKPNDITLEKALELLLSKDVKRCGRPKNKPKLEEAIEAA